MIAAQARPHRVRNTGYMQLNTGMQKVRRASKYLGMIFDLVRSDSFATFRKPFKVSVKQCDFGRRNCVYSFSISE